MRRRTLLRSKTRVHREHKSSLLERRSTRSAAMFFLRSEFFTAIGYVMEKRVLEYEQQKDVYLGLMEKGLQWRRRTLLRSKTRAHRKYKSSFLEEELREKYVSVLEFEQQKDVYLDLEEKGLQWRRRTLLRSKTRAHRKHKSSLLEEVREVLPCFS
ncbi:hypothetical protein CEXT_453581 [Caerostris extrusa]|uniref:Uncharacterized protein n=1 Tax=Caerostris extrusa TaxID=172846 RepID=A0AAV4ND35_CAEEX|nr:hypothetical protein CEXT_453581 [Caerostris extrusa]